MNDLTVYEDKSILVMDNIPPFCEEEYDLFDKKDFAKGDDDEEFFEEENNHTFLKVILIIIGLSSLFTAIYFILKEYTNIF